MCCLALRSVFSNALILSCWGRAVYAKALFIVYKLSDAEAKEEAGLLRRSLFRLRKAQLFDMCCDEEWSAELFREESNMLISNAI